MCSDIFAYDPLNIYNGTSLLTCSYIKLYGKFHWYPKRKGVLLIFLIWASDHQFFFYYAAFHLCLHCLTKVRFWLSGPLGLNMTS